MLQLVKLGLDLGVYGAGGAGHPISGHQNGGQ